MCGKFELSLSLKPGDQNIKIKSLNVSSVTVDHFTESEGKSLSYSYLPHIMLSLCPFGTITSFLSCSSSWRLSRTLWEFSLWRVLFPLSVHTDTRGHFHFKLLSANICRCENAACFIRQMVYLGSSDEKNTSVCLVRNQNKSIFWNGSNKDLT